MGYTRAGTGTLTDAQQRVLKVITELGSASPNQLWAFADLGIGKVMIQRHLKSLVATGLVAKLGSPPRVFYVPIRTDLPTNSELYAQVAAFTATDQQQLVLNKSFGFDADFTLYRGTEAFKRWFLQKQVPGLIKQKSQRHPLQDQVRDNYETLLASFISRREDVALAVDARLGVIDATDRYRSIHASDVIKRVFYQDFYSLPQFGKSLLGLIVQKAKVGEQSSLSYIAELSDLLQQTLPRLAAAFQCDGCAWVPHTLKRAHALQDLLQKSVDLRLHKIALTKVVAGDVVPQKSLSDLDQRLHNAFVTNHVSEAPAVLRRLKSILLIDDAIGSNATIQAIGQKIKTVNPKISIYAYAPVGSFKGFDVVRDI